jgi:hypothetical protein
MVLQSVIPASSETATAAPLRISTAPLPGDLHLTVYAAPDAPLGMIDVHLSAGRGSRGRGKRPLDDAHLYADVLRRLANHLHAYAADYEQAAMDDAADADDAPEAEEGSHKFVTAQETTSIYASAARAASDKFVTAGAERGSHIYATAQATDDPDATSYIYVTPGQAPGADMARSGHQEAPDVPDVLTLPPGQPCRYCGAMSPWAACGACIPF